ncbi:hypothetical protein [Bacillus cereus]|uniref:hypothetical protein n=1 Tax=Bacillus cereus TaxID=1396 RepID=UPI0018CD871B|nr:hypothetical protein [Bacillus cereus]MBG9617623.1 hypothetical protein [Bacillus cereus]
MTFLYRFDLKENGINFILNEHIAAGLLPQYDVLLRPLVTSLAEMLLMYCSLSKHPTILMCSILDNGELEMILSEELGQHIDAYTKNQIVFKYGKRIADILMEIMYAHTLYH